MAAFVFLCFEEHFVELTEAENCCRMGWEPLQNRSASLYSSYGGCNLTTCGLLKNTTLPSHGIHNSVNKCFQSWVGCPPFPWSAAGNTGKNSGSLPTERMWFWVCDQGRRQFPFPVLSLGYGASHVALLTIFSLIEKWFVQLSSL